MKSPLGRIKGVILMLLGVGGLLIFLISLKESDENPLKNQKEVNLPILSEDEIGAQKDNFALTEALVTGKKTNCDVIENPLLKNECEESLDYALATQNVDGSSCEGLNSQELKQKCLDKFYFKLALEKREMASCEKIIEMNLKNNCLEQLKEFFAEQSNTPKNCEELASAPAKANCLDSFKLRQAVKSQNPTLCTELSTTLGQTQCLETIEQNKQIIEASQEAMKNRTQ